MIVEENKVIEDEECDNCAICFNKLNHDDTYTIPECKHKFHTNCIMTWFRMGHSKCPLCNDKGINQDINQSNLNKDLSMQLGGAIIFSQIILKYFVEQNKGNLIHISSIFGIQAPKFHHYEGTTMTSPIEYGAIKSGIISITKWLAKYYKNQNIRVNCISPGGILDNQPNSFLDKYRESCTNIGMLNADDLVSTISLLLSSKSRAINGQNIIIDDGWSL